MAALLTTVTASGLVLFVPFVRMVGAGPPARPPWQSIVELEGWRAVILGAIPVTLCAVPLLLPRRVRRPAILMVAVVFAGGVLLGAPTVGLFYLPSAVLLAVAGAHAAGATRRAAAPAGR